MDVNVVVNITVPNQRGLLRSRPQEETEPGTWLVRQEDDTTSGTSSTPFAPVQQVHLRSLNSQQESIIHFVNNSGRRVRAIWLDFHGNEVGYSVIEPDAKKKYRTYVTHPWIMRDAESGQRMMLGQRMVIYASTSEHAVSITMPPALEWSLETHRFFPDTFKQQANALLLSHNHLRQGHAWVPAVARMSLDNPYPPTSSPMDVDFPAAQSMPLSSPKPPCARGPASLLLSWMGRFIKKHQPVPAAMAVPAPSEQPCIKWEQLGDLPTDLVLRIAHFMAPTDVVQDITRGTGAHPDILPALVPSDPSTWEPYKPQPDPAQAPAAQQPQVVVHGLAAALPNVLAVFPFAAAPAPAPALAQQQ